jgi:leucyl/phenylalanyl-tRNA--protein transferase
MIEPFRALARNIARRAVSLAFRQRAQLSVDNVLAEYRRGRYPLTERFGKLVWHEPATRAIMPLDDRFHVPGDVRRLLRRGTFHVTFDTAFGEVIAACASQTTRRSPLWITPEIVAAYRRLHDAGIAHSVEVWRESTLVGGGYGLAIGGVFAGESMFSRESHASKVGFVHLVEHLRERGFALQDAQEASNFSRQFGVIEVSRDEYRALLADALTRVAHFRIGGR